MDDAKYKKCQATGQVTDEVLIRDYRLNFLSHIVAFPLDKKIKFTEDEIMRRSQSNMSEHKCTLLLCFDCPDNNNMYSDLAFS